MVINHFSVYSLYIEPTILQKTREEKQKAKNLLQRIQKESTVKDIKWHEERPFSFLIFFFNIARIVE